MNVPRVRQVLLGIILIVLGAVAILGLSFAGMNVILGVLEIIDGILWLM